MSKSSFLLLLITVASLAAAAGVQAGGVRVGKPEWQYEAHEDVTSLQDDYHSFRSEAERAPAEIRYFVADIARDCRFLAVDFRSEARRTARYISDLFGHDRAEDASAAR